MRSPLPGRPATVGGAGLLALGALFAAVLVLTTPFTGCTEVGVPEGADTGFEFRGVQDGSIVYSPDGVNECQSPVEVATIPLVPLVGGVALLAYSRVTRRRAPPQASPGS
jgi:hypothetical protein